MTDQVAAETGELCSCGRAATVAFITADGRRVPWCGVALSAAEAAEADLDLRQPHWFEGEGRR